MKRNPLLHAAMAVAFIIGFVGVLALHLLLVT